MYSFWQKPLYRLVILTAASFFVFLNSIARQNQVGPVPRLVLNSVAAVHQGLAGSASWIASVAGRYVYLVGIKDRLDRAEQERDYLLAERHRLIELARENARLRSLAGLRETLGGDLLPAHVIGVSDDPTVITIDQGSFRSVVPGQAVISSGGVVGQIWYAGEFTSTVLLLSDARSRVPAYAERSRARGIITGYGNDEPIQAARVRRTDDVKTGDLFISAGSGLIFPRGLPVARVVSVGDPGNELTLPIVVEPAVDVNLLDEVMVVRLRADTGTDPAASGAAGTPAQPETAAIPVLQSRAAETHGRNP